MSTTRKRFKKPANSNLELREAWKSSRFPYDELVYKSSQLIQGPTSADTKAAQKHVKSVLKGAKANKVRFTLFVCLGATLPFGVFAANATPLSLVSAVSLSLVMSFAYLVLYSLQILPSFSNAEAYSLLSTLPLSEEDFSKITMLSFVRTFDYLAISSILVPVGAVAILSRSLLGSILMLGASAINAVFAIVVGLWLSRQFYKNIMRGGRSKGAQLSRTLFLISWGLAVLFIGFSFYLETSFLPYLDKILAGNLSQPIGVALSWLYPFTFGIVISSIVFPTLVSSAVFGGSASVLLPMIYGAALVYVITALFAGVRTSRMISSIGHGQQGVTIVRQVVKEFKLRLRKPLFAYITKDVRAASKNPATAFLFALPIFEAVMIVISLSTNATLGIFDFALMTMIGATIALTTGPLLLNTEGQGLQYTLSLPVGRNVIVNSKSLISTLIYAPVPFVLLLEQFVKSGNWGVSSLIPFIEIMAISAATTIEIALLMTGSLNTTHVRVMKSKVDPLSSKSNSGSSAGFGWISGTNFSRMIKALVIAFGMIIAPIVSYVVGNSLGLGESISIIVMAFVSILELAVAHSVLRR